MLLPYMSEKEHRPEQSIGKSEPFKEVIIRDSKPYIEGDSGEFPRTEFT